MGFIKEFKEFALKGNVLDMAIGVIIGGAFGKIVSSLVDDILMPLVGVVTGNVDFNSLVYKFGEGDLAATIKYGTFIQNVWNGNGTLAESLGYDACTNCLIRKVYTYNSYGLPTSCTIYGQGLPAGGLTTYTAYNSDGSVASTTDGNGNISTFTYDAAGQLLEERDPVGDKVTFTYDDARNLVSVRDKMNHVTTYEYTISGKTKKTTYPDGSVVSCMYDALEDMLPQVKLQDMMAKHIIQIAPLAFMRGRTLSDAVVILDEAQNTTPQQIRMFLTRMGWNTKMIITGDTSQIDLPRTLKSGLIEALQILDGTEGIGIVTLNQKDIVRHKLVTRIVKAYEEHDKKTEERDD